MVTTLRVSVWTQRVGGDPGPPRGPGVLCIPPPIPYPHPSGVLVPRVFSSNLYPPEPGHRSYGDSESRSVFGTVDPDGSSTVYLVPICRTGVGTGTTDGRTGVNHVGGGSTRRASPAPVPSRPRTCALYSVGQSRSGSTSYGRRTTPSSLSHRTKVPAVGKDFKTHGV